MNLFATGCLLTLLVFVGIPFGVLLLALLFSGGTGTFIGIAVLAIGALAIAAAST